MAGAATVEKALDVLFHLHAAEVSLGLGEIARALGLAKSSCHRLLASLVEREVVEQDRAGRYRPGLALLALGLGAQRREPVVELARPALEAGAEALGETVFLVAERRGRLRVLDKCEGTGFLRAAPGVGDEIPSDVTAAGKLYAVFANAGSGSGLGTDSREASRRGAAEAEVAAVEREAIVRAGYAVNRDAWIEGLSVLAVPIWQRVGERDVRMAAVIALAAGSARFEAVGEERIAAQLLRSAGEIGARLGAGVESGDHGASRAAGQARGKARAAARASEESDREGVRR